jgi:hypothetical protein
VYCDSVGRLKLSGAKFPKCFLVMLSVGGAVTKKLAEIVTKLAPGAEIFTLPVYGTVDTTRPVGSADIVTVPPLTVADNQWLPFEAHKELHW